MIACNHMILKTFTYYLDLENYQEFAISLTHFNNLTNSIFN